MQQSTARSRRITPLKRPYDVESLRLVSARSITFWLASLIAIGSIYVRIHGMLHPADAAAGFGIPLHNVSDYAFRTQRIWKEETMTTRPRADECRTVAIAGANGMVGHNLVEHCKLQGIGSLRGCASLRNITSHLL